MEHESLSVVVPSLERLSGAYQTCQDVRQVTHEEDPVATNPLSILRNRICPTPTRSRTILYEQPLVQAEVEEVNWWPNRHATIQ